MNSKQVEEELKNKVVEKKEEAPKKVEEDEDDDDFMWFVSSIIINYKLLNHRNLWWILDIAMATACKIENGDLILMRYVSLSCLPKMIESGYC